jgi:syntaxin 16
LYSDGKEALLSKGSESEVAINVPFASELPPEWVDIVEQIQKDAAAIKQNIQTLRGLHDRRLKISFGEDEVDCDRDVNDLTQEITSKLKKCENSLKRIASVGNERGATLPKQERVVRLNVMRALAQ